MTRPDPTQESRMPVRVFVRRKPFTNDVREGIAGWIGVWQAASDRGGCSARERARRGRHGQGVRVTDVELGVLGEHSVWQ